MGMLTRASRRPRSFGSFAESLSTSGTVGVLLVAGVSVFDRRAR
jgi:hypothetical protein